MSVKNFYYQTFADVPSCATDPCSGLSDCTAIVNGCEISPASNTQITTVSAALNYKVSVDILCQNIAGDTAYRNIIHLTYTPVTDQDGTAVSNPSEIKKYLDTHPHKISISDFNWSGNFSKDDFNCRSNKLKETRVCPGYWNGSISEEQMREMEQSSMLHCSAMRRYKYLWMPIGSYIDFHHNIRLSQERGRKLELRETQIEKHKKLNNHDIPTKLPFVRILTRAEYEKNGNYPNMTELENQRFIRYPISSANKGLAVILKVDATAYVDATIWMEETWSDIRAKIGNCTKIFNGKIAYNKENCFINENETISSSRIIDSSIPFDDQKDAKISNVTCIPSTIDYSICQKSEKSLTEILEGKGWSQTGLMKQFHKKNFFLERSKVLERYAFFKGDLYTTDEYFSTQDDFDEDGSDGKCKLFHVCGGLPWQNNQFYFIQAAEIFNGSAYMVFFVLFAIIMTGVGMFLFCFFRMLYNFHEDALLHTENIYLATIIFCESVIYVMELLVSIHIPIYILLAFPKEDIEIILDFFGNNLVMYYGCLKVFMMSSSLYHTVINILDIIYVSVMEIDFEDVKWIPNFVKKQSHKLISLLFGWLPALIFSIAPLFLDSIFFSMNLNSYTAVMDGNPRLILTLEFFAALLPHFLIICLSSYSIFTYYRNFDKDEVFFQCNVLRFPIIGALIVSSTLAIVNIILQNIARFDCFDNSYYSIPSLTIYLFILEKLIIAKPLIILFVMLIIDGDFVRVFLGQIFYNSSCYGIVAEVSAEESEFEQQNLPLSHRHSIQVEKMMKRRKSFKRGYTLTEFLLNLGLTLDAFGESLSISTEDGDINDADLGATSSRSANRNKKSKMKRNHKKMQVRINESLTPDLPRPKKREINEETVKISVKKNPFDQLTDSPRQNINLATGLTRRKKLNTLERQNTY
ncbi:Oidioi.mRNA.OKI2018_I69.chr1.g622.t1.cds [Oikopleura dioica]|uniref:Oidioi.mRNA.OKI2018_I69.chr1.g622.t1.cds n=1 Tax=Oikopleura dioica TaxID=34765 RepID=A0ABN7SSL2_OIKDI|nr:Oidioi.mRNA.OKI2018_I69.chr1.g622.t1.cds [Oikopleura dioica]